MSDQRWSNNSHLTVDKKKKKRKEAEKEGEEGMKGRERPPQPPTDKRQHSSESLAEPQEDKLTAAAAPLP